MLASHGGGANAWFLVALLVPAVLGTALWRRPTPIGNRNQTFQPLVAALVVAVSGSTLHVSLVTWRYKDVAMWKSWQPSGESNAVSPSAGHRARVLGELHGPPSRRLALQRAVTAPLRILPDMSSLRPASRFAATGCCP